MTSSVGRKILMGLTGLLLVGFLLEHLLGNIKLYEDPSGAAFDAYVSFLASFGLLLPLAELALALLFLAHIYLALRLTLENLQARRVPYVIRNNRGATSPGSVSMVYTGTLILAYLLKHLYDFRFDRTFSAAPASHVQATLCQPINAIIYLISALILGLHLSHGFRSALQSLGLSHSRWNTALHKLGIFVAILLLVGFISFPVYFLLFFREGLRP